MPGNFGSRQTRHKKYRLRFHLERKTVTMPKGYLIALNKVRWRTGTAVTQQIREAIHMYLNRMLKAGILEEEDKKSGSL